MRIVNLQTGLLLLTDWERATRSYWQEKELLEHTPIAYYGSSSLKVPDYPIHSNLAPGAAGVPVGYGPEPVYNAAFPAFEPPQGNSYPAHRPPSTFNTIGPLNSSLHYNDNSFNRLGPSYATSIPDWDDPSTTQTHAKMLGGPVDFESMAASQTHSIGPSRDFSARGPAASTAFSINANADNWVNVPVSMFTR